MAKIRPEDFTMFKKSSPWGYHPVMVEDQIKKYDESIAAITEKYLNARQLCYKMAAKIEQLENELRDMHLQMSSLELPEASEAVEHFVLNDFRNYNSNNANDSIPSPNIVSDDKTNLKKDGDKFHKRASIKKTGQENEIIGANNNYNENYDEDDGFVIIT